MEHNATVAAEEDAGRLSAQGGQNSLRGEENPRALGHAYILAGPPVGQRAFAVQLAQKMLCTGSKPLPCGDCPNCHKAIKGIHPDLVWVKDTEKPISVDRVRAVRKDAYIRPNEAPCKVYVFEDAGEMNASSQNALLNILEEGPAYAAFLLLAENELALLQTVRSRCELLRIPPAEVAAGAGQTEEEGEALSTAKALVPLLLGADELAALTACIALEKWEREKLLRLMEALVQTLRGGILAGDAVKLRLTLVETAQRCARALQFNTGAGHVAGMLCAAAFSEEA